MCAIDWRLALRFDWSPLADARDLNHEYTILAARQQLEEHDSRAAPLSTRPLRVLALTAAAAAAVGAAADAGVGAASVNAVAVALSECLLLPLLLLLLALRRTRLSPSVRVFSLFSSDWWRRSKTNRFSAFCSTRSADLHTTNSFVSATDLISICERARWSYISSITISVYGCIANFYRPLNLL